MQHGKLGPTLYITWLNLNCSIFWKKIWPSRWWLNFNSHISCKTRTKCLKKELNLYFHNHKLCPWPLNHNFNLWYIMSLQKYEDVYFKYSALSYNYLIILYYFIIKNLNKNLISYSKILVLIFLNLCFGL